MMVIVMVVMVMMVIPFNLSVLSSIVLIHRAYTTPVRDVLASIATDGGGEEIGRAGPHQGR